VEVVASLSQGRTVAAQCGLFTHKSVPVIIEPPCKYLIGFVSLLKPLRRLLYCCMFEKQNTELH